MTRPTLQQILTAPGSDAEREEAIRHFYPEKVAEFDSAPVESGAMRAAKQFGKRTGETLKGLGSMALDAARSASTLEGQVSYLPKLAAGMYEGAVQYGADAIARQLPKGAEEATVGQIARAGVAAVPVVGGYGMNRVSDVEEGHGPEAAGDVIFDAASLLVPGTSAGRAGLGAAASGATRAAAATGRGAATVARAIGPEAAGAAIGMAGGSILSGVGGAATARFLRPIVAKIIKQVRGVSGAKAEAIAMGMEPAELVKIAREGLPDAVPAPSGAIQPSPVSGSYGGGVAQVRQPAPVAPTPPPATVAAAVDEVSGLPLNPDGTVTVRIGGDSLNIKPERLAAKPIPPNKLPRVLPDPVVPEIAIARSEGGSLWDTKTGKPIKLSAEEAREAVANLHWNKAKPAPAPVSARRSSQIRDVEPPPAPVASKPTPPPMLSEAEQITKAEETAHRLALEGRSQNSIFAHLKNDHGIVPASIRSKIAEAATPHRYGGLASEEVIAGIRAKGKPSISGVAEGAKITIQPALAERIGSSISPDAAWKDLQKHGAGDGKRIPSKEAREMVDAVWSDKEPGYTSIEQWMADRRDRWDAMRTSSKKAKKPKE